MTITTRNNQNHTTQAELTPQEINTIMWALHYTSHMREDESLSNRATKLRDDLCGIDKATVHFDGRGKNGL